MKVMHCSMAGISARFAPVAGGWMKKADQTFSGRLRQLRILNQLTTREVAQFCKVAESTYREWEYGRNIRGSESYRLLADIFKVSLAELMIGEDGKKSSIEDDLKKIEEILKIIRMKL